MTVYDFVCRFRLTSLQSVRQHDGGPGVMVTLVAVQGEPFGKYTPYGEIKMTILNPRVAAQLSMQWNDYVTSKDPKAQAPLFEVPFHLLTAVEA